MLYDIVYYIITICMYKQVVYSSSHGVYLYLPIPDTDFIQRPITQVSSLFVL